MTNPTPIEQRTIVVQVATSSSTVELIQGIAVLMRSYPAANLDAVNAWFTETCRIQDQAVKS